MITKPETIKEIFKSLVSPDRDYQKFRMQKNKLLLQFSCKDILNPSVDKIVEVLGTDNINIITDEEKLNIVMFICVWRPTMLERMD
jgi:hypothetical protein